MGTRPILKQSVRYDTVATLLKELAKLNLCQGLNTFHNGLKKHVVAKNIDPFEDGTVVAGQENGREFLDQRNVSSSQHQKSVIHAYHPNQEEKEQPKKFCLQQRLKHQSQGRDLQN